MIFNVLIVKSLEMSQECVWAKKKKKKISSKDKKTKTCKKISLYGSF